MNKISLPQMIWGQLGIFKLNKNVLYCLKAKKVKHFMTNRANTTKAKHEEA